MLNISPATRIFFAPGATDMRRGFNGLAAMVSNELLKSPTSGHLFVFCNRSRNRIKVLYSDGSGLWVCAKRLERGTFSWPASEKDVGELTPAELALLLEGIDLERSKKRAWRRQLEEKLTTFPAPEKFFSNLS